jgi:RNA polymerase sigma factor (sigma-70 family)
MADRYGPFQAGSRARLRFAADERLVKSVRRGDRAAFEVLYDRHAAGLLSFCLYMLGSRHDAEDAVQATFACAYRSLLADDRPVRLRPWLFTIARNASLSILRRRHPTVELNGEPAMRGDPQRELELRDEVRQLLGGLRALPECQRTTLTLAELHGLSHSEIASVLGVRTEQVKAYAYQARANLLSERTARETSCHDIRRELLNARGVDLRKTRLNRHLRSCSDCREYRKALSSQRQQLASLFPAVPSLALKMRALHGVVGNVGLSGPAAEGAAVAGTAVAAGGSLNALVVKLAAGVAALGAGAGVGAAVLGGPIASEEHGSRAGRSEATPQLSASAHPGAAGPSLTAAQAAIPGASALLRAEREEGHLARLLAYVAAPPASTRYAGSGGAAEPAISGRSIASEPGERSAQKQQVHLAEEERRRQHEASSRLHEERERAAEERVRAGAAHAVKAAAERLEQREERRSARATRAPKTKEEHQQQHERGRRRFEELHGPRERYRSARR